MNKQLYRCGLIQAKHLLPYYSVTNKCTHTLHQKYDNILKYKLRHISGLTAPSLGTAQLYKTIAQPFCNPQYIELSQVRQCTSIEVDICTVCGTGCRFQCDHREHSDLRAVPVSVHISIFIFIHWRTCDNYTHWGWQKSWTIVLHNCAVPDDGPVRPETCRSMSIKTLS